VLIGAIPPWGCRKAFMMDVRLLPSFEPVILAEALPVSPVKRGVRQSVSWHVLAARDLPEAYLDATQSELVADVVEVSEKVLVVDRASARVGVIVDPPLGDIGHHAADDIGGIGLDDNVFDGQAHD
jgi:hypothetical protein